MYCICEKLIFSFCRPVKPLPNDKFLDSSSLKEFVNNNFEFDKNGRNFSKRVENTVETRCNTVLGVHRSDPRYICVEGWPVSTVYHLIMNIFTI